MAQSLLASLRKFRIANVRIRLIFCKLIHTLRTSLRPQMLPRSPFGKYTPMSKRGLPPSSREKARVGFYDFVAKAREGLRVEFFIAGQGDKP